MNIPEPELQLGEKLTFLVRDGIFKNFSREDLIKLKPSEPDLDIDNPCPVIKRISCRINGRAYEVDDQRWIYHWHTNHGYFPSCEEQELMGWYPIENYEKVKANEP